MRSALPAAALALTVAVLLTGCFPQDPEVAPPPEPTVEPVFATDEEALAAATDAYEAYLEMSDLIAQEGGKNPERIAPYVTEEWLDRSADFFESLADSGRRQVGDSTLRTADLQQHYSDGHGAATVVIYVCIDYSAVQLLDRRDENTVPSESPSTLPVEATLKSEDGALKLSGNEPWTSDSFC